jgi:hypothetical protein
VRSSNWSASIFCHISFLAPPGTGFSLIPAKQFKRADGNHHSSSSFPANTFCQRERRVIHSPICASISAMMKGKFG